MTLAKGARPRANFCRLVPIVIGAGLLAACQSAGEAPPPEVRADAWRVVERVGEARYLAPGTTGWAAALPATTLPDGSRVTTGAGGRLILARAADHVSAGPGSQFSLPDAAPGAALEQTAGRLRYRLAEPPPFAVATPALAIEVAGSVFDVTVGADATEVAVERGRLRVSTPDGQREIRLEAGQSAQASGHEALAFRRASGQPLERVERLILPALEPKPAVAEGDLPGSPLTVARAATNQASTSAAASVESAVPVATAALSAGASEVAAPAALAALPATTEATSATTGNAAGDRAVEDAPTIAAAPAADPPAEAIGEDPRLLFDRLTEGVLDAIPAQRAPKRSPARARI
jgi:hypothetical protein